VKRTSGRTESPVQHALGPVSQAVSTQPAIGTAAHTIPNVVKRPTDLSDDPDQIPKDTHSVRFLAHEFYHRHVVKERQRRPPGYVNACSMPTCCRHGMTAMPEPLPHAK
jgi:hypothetical protein